MRPEHLESLAQNEFTPEGGAIGRRQNRFRNALFKTVNFGVHGFEDAAVITGKVVGGVTRGTVKGIKSTIDGIRGKNIHP